MRLAVVGVDDPLTQLVTEHLRETAEVPSGQPWPATPANRAVARLSEEGIQTVVHLPVIPFRDRREPNLAAAEELFAHCPATVRHLVLISSAAIREASFTHPAWIGEKPAAAIRTAHPIARRWIALERLAEKLLGHRRDLTLTILRPVPVPMRDGRDYFSRLFRGRFALCVCGHDPSLQLLSPEDLAAAVKAAVTTRAGGIFHLAPDDVVPLRAALRRAGVRALPVPYSLQAAFRFAVRGCLPPWSRGWCHHPRQLDYVRYFGSVANAAARRTLGVAPRGCAAALDRLRPDPAPADPAAPWDDFGFDPAYVSRRSRTLLRFLNRCYWRLETRGLEQVPRTGPAVLVGFHRGFMPWDAIMVVELLFRRLGRCPRFLVHPGLFKFPFSFNVITKLGGVMANLPNAERILARGELLGIYPEGVHGGFALYRDVYRLRRFLRDDFVRLALRHRAPIVPFVLVGSAETFPIFGKLEWRWWKRWARWPYIPLTPTFPLLPLPLPAKWHLCFLPPLEVATDHPPAAADDPATVAGIRDEVRRRMAETIDAMLRQRKSIFRGSIFPDHEAPSC